LSPLRDIQEEGKPRLTFNRIKVASAYLLSNMAWGPSAQKTEDKQNQGDDFLCGRRQNTTGLPVDE
jgi:hypothetical protein